MTKPDDLNDPVLLQDFLQHGVPVEAELYFHMAEAQTCLTAIVDGRHEFERIFDPLDEDAAQQALDDLIDFMKEIAQEKP